ncbi:hypothetical protein HPB51_016456 [Rhipicephalus microplus]|uniref:C2H2-type domain-containing protein n=2 Tax=Rhipicephalus microplus TaxID=6941 RepID=A0A9J6DW54_RHIMP|nr:hypothetical protein HPB51_016456 [Rhipicephalus microplus]
MVGRQDEDVAEAEEEDDVTDQGLLDPGGAEVASAVATLGLSQEVDPCGLGVKLEDGSTAFLQGLGGTTHAITLEDGSTAYIQAGPRGAIGHAHATSCSQAVSCRFDILGIALPVIVRWIPPLGPFGEAGMGHASGDDNCEEDETGARSTNIVHMSNGGTNNGTPTEKAFMCRVEGCGKTYTTLHHLKVHGRAHTGDRPFKCLVDGCNKSFVTGYGLKSHTRVHTGETPYRCTHDGCIKTFKTSGDLQKHVRTHTGERPFKCPFEDCNCAFTTSNIRKVHMRTHTGERPYVCKEENCGRSFASATNYKNHIRIHTGEKPYVCTVPSCGKRFTEYSSLYKHHVVHTHNKPYMCNLCGKNYRQTSTLAMHKRTAHGLLIDDARLGEKPYVCTVPSCGKRFTEYSSLYKHHVVHTHNKPYMCNLCGKNYRQTSTLAMHKRTAHGLLIDDACLELGVEEEEMEGDLDEAGTIQDAAGIMEETSPTGRRRRAGGMSSIPSTTTLVVQQSPATGVLAMHLEKTTKTRENFGGWVLPVEQMDNLKKKPYLYNASAGSERTLYPMAALVSLSTCLWATFKTGLMIAHPVMFLVTYGFAFAKITIRLVLTTVSYGELDLWDSSLVAPLFLCLNALLNATPLSLPISSALMCAMVYSVMDFTRYFTYASWDMRDALDVWIFSLKYPVGDPRCRNGNNGVYLTGLNNEELLEKTRTEASATGVGAVSSNGTKQKGGKLRLRKYLGRSVGKECLN